LRERFYIGVGASSEEEITMEQFTIHDTVDNFVSWVDRYGRRKQPLYYVPLRLQLDRLLHHAGDENESFGTVVFSFREDPKKDKLFQLTAEPWPSDHPPSEKLIAYLQEMAAAIRAEWPQNEYSLAAPAEPKAWVKALEDRGIKHGSGEWWAFIEQWTRDYWHRKGRASLPIQGTLEKITGYRRTQIYAKTSFRRDSEQ
jgi:hypothetical protein